ncbi:unnamed protein product, partial [Prorocentrum cordatum]
TAGRPRSCSAPPRCGEPAGGCGGAAATAPQCGQLLPGAGEAQQGAAAAAASQMPPTQPLPPTPAEELDQAALVAKVKAYCKEEREHKTRWRRFCRAHEYPQDDPKMKPVEFLRDFWGSVQEAASGRRGSSEGQAAESREDAAEQGCDRAQPELERPPLKPQEPARARGDDHALAGGPAAADAAEGAPLADKEELARQAALVISSKERNKINKQLQKQLEEKAHTIRQLKEQSAQLKEQTALTLV